ncbi:nucleotide-binding universal stress UspA family protein [Sphingobium fontiphilum]|uniref:Nucleotide-binding universal stress UspA family protein n=1 Tax=Sphingobium fontiphilum TaxID=944425 RepID=A0A7W6DJA4_9SPHN|nr:universal stress protein [Sphingobium fontiphilum]MBB3981612.1 nucleotide-binding universal stress UspA family protein [Sphingobium fontiphilum]
MRTYMVVLDESPEAETALRFAARRAAKTGGAVRILALVPPTEFVQWGSVQATMEDEARQRAEALVVGAAGTLMEEAGLRPTTIVRQGDPVEIVLEMLQEHETAALVLGAAASGPPGPLVAHFAGADAGALPCPVMVIPGGLDMEAIDRLS